MTVKTIKQSMTFHATPREVYDALMSSKKHAQFTGASARISTKIGGSFRAYDDYISGKNIELVEGKKIVQAWRASDWPEECYSTVTFTFKKIAGGTRLTFVQTGVPAEQYEDIKQGWHDYYWEPMKQLFAQ